MRSGAADCGCCAEHDGHQFDVRYWGQSGHCTDLPPCPLLTQSGHWQLKIVAVQLVCLGGGGLGRENKKAALERPLSFEKSGRSLIPTPNCPSLGSPRDTSNASRRARSSNYCERLVLRYGQIPFCRPLNRNRGGRKDHSADNSRANQNQFTHGVLLLRRPL
jgi:hypothetical protein